MKSRLILVKQKSKTSLRTKYRRQYWFGSHFSSHATFILPNQIISTFRPNKNKRLLAIHKHKINLKRQWCQLVMSVICTHDAHHLMIDLSYTTTTGNEIFLQIFELTSKVTFQMRMSVFTIQMVLRQKYRLYIFQFTIKV